MSYFARMRKTGTVFAWVAVIGAGLCGLAFAAAPRADAVSANASAEPPEISDSITLYAGEARVQRVPVALKRVAVGDGKLLEVRSIGDRELVLIARAAGDTTLHLWLRDGSQRDIAIHVGAGNAEQTAAMVRRLLEGGRAISVNNVAGNVVLSGNNLSSAELAQVAAVKQLYPQVLDFTTANAVEMRPMVMMQVRIMEFDKRAMDEIGIKWDTIIEGPNGGLVHDFSTNRFFRQTPGTFPGLDASGSNVNLPLRVPGTPSFFGIATSISSRINLAMNSGSAWELATPQLAARSGGVADFLVGGEVPIPVTRELGETSVQFKPFGIRLHIEPVINSAGEIATNLETEVSRIDPSITVAGFPGFITRRVSAELNVREGETIVISGLVDANAAKGFDRVPGLGRIPILGALFSSRNFQRNRTELVIFVTPWVVGAGTEHNKRMVERGEQLHDKMRDLGGLDVLD